LYQGTASAVPKDREKGLGFSPCGLRKAPVASMRRPADVKGILFRSFLRF
jgi:hypothetical protein